MGGKVWVIEDGEYSDYHVVGVFSSRENAELVRSKLKSGDIEEWDLDPAVDKLNAGMEKFYVHMLRDGTARCGRRPLIGISARMSTNISVPMPAVTQAWKDSEYGPLPRTSNTQLRSPTKNGCRR